MTTYTPTFNVEDYELRNYTNPYLTSKQNTEVTQVEDRVQGQLDFLAQMLGWNGPNYWGNLTATADQKRQLLGGTFGVYNSYLIPKIFEIRNFDNKILIDKLQFLRPGVSIQVARIVLGDKVYQIQSVEVEGDKYAISIGTLTPEFFDLIENNTQVLVEIPNYRPAPFNRQKIGVSGDYGYICGQDGATLTLYPGYDNKKQFIYSLILFTLFVENVSLLKAYYRLKNRGLLPLLKLSNYLLGKYNKRLLLSGRFTIRMFDFFKLSMLLKQASTQDK
jgi:hypothetical protein